MNGIYEALLVALGGGIGAAGRYWLDTRITQVLMGRGGNAWRFPWGIVIVNLSGSLMLGALVGAGVAWPALGVGLLGGYTTFSTTSLDTVRLMREGRTGAALLNAFGMLGSAMLLACIGLLLGAWLRH